MVDFDTVRNSVPGGDTVADCHDDGLDLSSTGRRMEPGTIPATMCKEECRLHTFHHWPSDWGTDLARFGFCSLSGDSEGSVRCAFCGLEIPDFSSPQDAQLKHWQCARHYCRFLQGEDVGNIPLNGSHCTMPGSYNGLSVTVQKMPSSRRTDMEETRLLRASASVPEQRCHHHVHSNQASSPNPSPLLAVPRSDPETTVSVTQASPQPASQAVNEPASSWPANSRHETESHEVHWTDLVRTARYPRMAFFQARLNTLRRWPLLKPSPTELARAGFFHVKCSPDTAHQPHSHPQQLTAGQGGGVEECGDSVKCFWCGERIHRWQRTDDALLEHARLSPSCHYVMQVLGQQCHDDIMQHLTSTYIRHHDSSHTTQLPSTVQPATPPTMTSSRLDDIMQSPSVQKVLQMGFPRQLIRDLLSHNSQRLTPDILCHLALRAAEQTPGPSSEKRRIPCGDTLKSAQSGRNVSSAYELTRLHEPQTYVQFTGTASSSHEQRNLDKSHTFVQATTNVSSTNEQRNLAMPAAPTSQARSAERLMCKVCSEAEVKVVFRPCNHLSCCQRCMSLFTSCPVCHQIIEDVLTVTLT